MSITNAIISEEDILNVLNRGRPQNELFISFSPTCNKKREDFDRNLSVIAICNHNGCSAQIWCHPYSFPFIRRTFETDKYPLCGLSREEIKSNEAKYMTTNGLCIPCLQEKVCCRAVNHPKDSIRSSSDSNNSDTNEALYEYINKIPSLTKALKDELDFKIPISSNNYYRKICKTLPYQKDFFEIGQHWENEYILLHWIFSQKTLKSEMDIITRDNYWIDALKGFLEFESYNDMVDVTSPYSKKRPDSIFTINATQFLRYEAKFSVEQIEEAEIQLKDSFFPGSYDSFPNGSDSIIGIVSTDKVINIYLINASNFSFDKHNPQINIANDFELKKYKCFNVVYPKERLLFFIEMLKILRWASSIVERNGHFHLIPNKKIKTNNGHEVQWLNGSLIKTFNIKKTTKTQLDRIKEVYNKRLKNVEWGNFFENNRFKVEITRIGTPLHILLSKGVINPREALIQIDAGINQLRLLGFVHCDLKLNNIYARYEYNSDKRKKSKELIVFLDDLEFLTPPDDPAPNVEYCNPNSRPSRKKKRITAEELHILQYSALKEEILSYEK